MASVTISFTLDTEEDERLIAWLKRIPKRQKSQEIRKALYAGIDPGGITLGDVYQAIREIDRKLGRGAAVATGSDGSETPEDENVPQDIKDALDNLGL